MCLNWDFYLDILCSFLLNTYDTFSSGCRRNVCLTEQDKKDREERLKIKVLLIRIGFGYVINIGGFLAVCLTNRETESEGNIAFFLFCVIYIYTVLFYASVTFMLVYRIYADRSKPLPDTRAEGFMMIYRMLEVIFDIAVMLYSLILSGWEMTEFTTATTALSCSDIGINCLILMKNCCSYHGNTDNDNQGDNTIPTTVSTDLTQVSTITTQVLTHATPLSTDATSGSPKPKPTERNKNKAKNNVEFNYSESTIMYGPVTVIVEKGNLIEKKVDVIVSTAPSDLNLKNGDLSRNILNAAGQEIQKDCNRKKFENNGKIVVVSGYQLPCKEVYFVNMPHWKGSSEEECLKEIVMDCLDKADKDGKTTLAFPLLGTSWLSFKPEVVAETLAKCFVQFSQTSSKLKHLYVIVYEGSKTGADEFKILMQTFRKQEGDRKYLESTIMYGPVAIIIEKGNITNKKVDVIVSNAPSDLNLEKGVLSKQILKAAGNKIQTECNSKKLQTDSGKLVKVSGYDLPCDQVYFANMPQWSGSSKCLEDIVTDCLHTADNDKKGTIAFPTLGTGSLGFQINVVAETFAKCFVQFSKTSGTRTLKHVHVIVYGNSSTCDLEFNVLMQTIRKQEGTVQCFKCHKMDVLIKYGDITEYHTDTIVSSAPENLDLKSTILSNSVLEKAGEEIQTECRKLQSSIKHGDVLTIPTTTFKHSKLNCRYVMFVCLPQWKKKSDNPKQTLVKSVKRSLKKATDLKLTTVAIPTLGLGGWGFPQTEMASGIVESVHDFVYKNKKTTLREISLVVFQHSNDRYAEFQALCDEFIKKKTRP